jgi:hypothetical protein
LVFDVNLIHDLSPIQRTGALFSDFGYYVVTAGSVNSK